MKFFTSILLVAVLLNSCTKKTDELFPEPSDERVAKALDNYKSVLMSAPGWKLFVYPKGLESIDIEVGGLTYYVTFPDSSRTQMVSDFTVSMASIPKESGYRLKAFQFPSLLFDTYSYIHVAADPDENVSFSPANDGGYGWGTDFEFSFQELEAGDTIKLKGNLNESEAVLIKVSQEEIDAAFNGQLADIVAVTSDYASNNAFLYFPSSSNEKIGVSLNLFLYIINFNYLENGQLVTLSAPFSHTIDGIHFKDPVTIGGYTFQDAYWDEALEIYYINTSSGRVNIVNSDSPLFPLLSVIGRSITTITVPTTALPGQSTTFANVYTEVKNNLKTSGLNLDLDVMRFIFDDATKTMVLRIEVIRGGITYIILYQFSYAFNGSGNANFTLTGYNANGQAVIDDVTPLLQYIEDDIFKLDYFNAGAEFLGQFTSQDNPGFFFTGTLQ